MKAVGEVDALAVRPAHNATLPAHAPTAGTFRPLAHLVILWARPVSSHIVSLKMNDDDKIYQKYWRQVPGISPVLHTIPQCRAGKQFLSCVTALLQAARGRHCNSEKIVVLVSVILQKKGVSKARNAESRTVWTTGKKGPTGTW
jgi:hypothetical protein